MVLAQDATRARDRLEIGQSRRPTKQTDRDRMLQAELGLQEHNAALASEFDALETWLYQSGELQTWHGEEFLNAFKYMSSQMTKCADSKAHVRTPGTCALRNKQVAERRLKMSGYMRIACSYQQPERPDLSIVRMTG